MRAHSLYKYAFVLCLGLLLMQVYLELGLVPGVREKSQERLVFSASEQGTLSLAHPHSLVGWLGCKTLY